MADTSKLDPKQKQKYIIAAISFVVIAVAIFFLFVFHKKPDEIKKQQISGEVKELAQIELKNKPYVTLTPTTDGAEIIISLENMSYFDNIEYELTYLADNPQVPSDKIQRGATGSDLNTQDPKYKKAILLGTASKGVKSPDRGITEGKLTLHLYKGEDQYLSETQWDMFEMGNKPVEMKTADGNFTVMAPATLGKSYWVILADTVGVPPSYDHPIENTITPVWGAFSVSPKFAKTTDVTLKLAKDAKSPVVHAFNLQEEKWSDPKSNYSAGDKTISATIDHFATFVVEQQKD